MLIVAAATAVLFGGCGGGDDDSAATTTTTTIVITTTTADPQAPPVDPFCQAFTLWADVTNDAPQNTLEQMQAKAALLKAGASSLVETAPDEVAEEVLVISASARELDATLSAATTLEEARDALTPFLDDREQQAAGETVTLWVADNCDPG